MPRGVQETMNKDKAVQEIKKEIEKYLTKKYEGTMNVPDLRERLAKDMIEFLNWKIVIYTEQKDFEKADLAREMLAYWFNEGAV